jgi:hypothetical protein
MGELFNLSLCCLVIGLNGDITDSVKAECCGGRNLGLGGTNQTFDKLYL